MKSSTTSVVIVEDITEIREGLQLLINARAEFECTSVFANAEAAITEIPQLQPNVVLMDIHLPGMNGIDCVKHLKPLCPNTLFIMSTVYEDNDNIFESLKVGASGYLLKKTSPDKILEAITEVMSGGSPMSSQIARKVISSFQKKDSIDDSDVLTKKEKEILKALAKGLRYKEIAAEMSISIETVRSHARNIYEKLQVQSRTEALNKIYGKK
jgi:DNA-binding NarL/FixJ family response regulator